MYESIQERTISGNHLKRCSNLKSSKIYFTTIDHNMDNFNLKYYNNPIKYNTLKIFRRI